jgi:hypothetical protein
VTLKEQRPEPVLSIDTPHRILQSTKNLKLNESRPISGMSSEFIVDEMSIRSIDSIRFWRQALDARNSNCESKAKVNFRSLVISNVCELR